MVQLARIIILSFLLWPVVSGADIYRYVDGDGVVHYSNTQAGREVHALSSGGAEIRARAAGILARRGS